MLRERAHKRTILRVASVPPHPRAHVRTSSVQRVKAVPATRLWSVERQYERGKTWKGWTHMVESFFAEKEAKTETPP